MPDGIRRSDSKNIYGHIPGGEWEEREGGGLAALYYMADNYKYTYMGFESVGDRDRAEPGI